MNKAPRFMIEYANFQIRCLEHNKLMNDGIRNEIIRRIDRTVRMFERGFITVDEAMRLISLPDSNEDMSQYAS